MKPFYDQFHAPTQRIKEAWEFAVEAHGSQTYGPFPYGKHLADVASCLERFGFTPHAAMTDRAIEDVICAGWLHDVLEDTGATRSQLESKFGTGVADAVARVTDEPGSSREERKTRTYPKIKGHYIATVVKLADRIANVEACLDNNESQFRKYVAEQPKFYSSLHFPMLAEAMWNNLRLLTETGFGKKPTPPTQVSLFYLKQSDIEIRVDATFDNGDLRVDDFALGERIRKMNAGDSDYERVLTVKKEFKDAVLLNLLRNQFWGNSSFSQLQSWLSANGVPYDTWSG